MFNIKRALISVSDKTGVIELAKQLARNSVEILSTGGTYKLLKENGINAIEISQYTGFPEIMSGRVKTLNPKIHGGILGRRNIDEQIMKEYDIKKIDLVVVNLYPFVETVSKPNVKLSEAIENIDIGGPAMIRSAAKNYNDVAVVTCYEDYDLILDSFTEKNLTLEKRFELACKAFEHTSSYDYAIANYLGKVNNKIENIEFSNTINNQYTLLQNLRYGENPHQKAAFYIDKSSQEVSVSTSRQLQGKELSYNNIVDIDTALECVKLFSEPACVIVKHANPCGIGESSNGILDAYKKAFETDKESAFGGIIAFNRILDKDTAKLIIENQFVEVIISPFISDDGLDVLSSKPNIRVLISGKLDSKIYSNFEYKNVVGGMLVQTRDLNMVNLNDLKIVTKKQPTEQQMYDLIFAWKVAKFVKSNAIVFAKNYQTLGIGAGQMSRVNSTRIAQIKAEMSGLSLEGSCLASDAFFPFKDGVEQAILAGASAIIQPGGSIRDKDVIQACDDANVTMVFTGIRHFRH